MTHPKTIILIGVLCLILAAIIQTAYAKVIRKGNTSYIVDRTGERWDISQAVSLGFKAEGFQYGIGRHTIKPLDETHFRLDNKKAADNARIIGIEKEAEAQAYAISKLVRHEIANTTIADDPIAAAY